MKTYTVYANPQSDDPQGEAEFVPEGFSFLMFLPVVNVVVAAYRRCWLLLVAIVAIEFLTYFASQSDFFNSLISQNGVKLNMLLRLATLFFFGLWVNDFWRAKLEKRGYEMVGVISVPSGFHSLEVAQQRFYDKMAGAAK